MTVLYEPGYSLPALDQPLTHARMLHAGNTLEGATITATSTETGYDVDNVDNWKTYSKWKATSTATQYITHTFGGAKKASCVALAGTNFETSQPYLNVEIYNGSIWLDLSINTLITSNAPIMVFFEERTYTAFRIKLSGSLAAPSISCLKWGFPLQFPRPFFGGHAPTDFNEETIIQGNESETGEFLGSTVRRVARPDAFTWRHIDYSWVEANWPSTLSSLRGKPVFWLAWRPDTTYDGVGFYRINKMPSAQFMGIRDLMEIQMTVRGLGW